MRTAQAAGVGGAATRMCNNSGNRIALNAYGEERDTVDGAGPCHMPDRAWREVGAVV